MTKETELKNQIKDYLKIRNICWWYNLQGIGAYRGLPDLMAIKGGVLYAIEVKAPKGIVSDYQENFLTELYQNGAVTIVARSLDDVMKHL